MKPTLLKDMKSKVLLFTSPTCPNCPPAKKFIKELSEERKDFSYEEISTFLPEAQKLAKKYEIRAVPTFIIKGPGYEHNIGYAGLPSKKKFNELLDLSMGKKKKEEKTEKKQRTIRIGRLKLKL